jgi:hypothetical protein
MCKKTHKRLAHNQQLFRNCCSTVAAGLIETRRPLDPITSPYTCPCPTTTHRPLCPQHPVGNLLAPWGRPQKAIRNFFLGELTMYLLSEDRNHEADVPNWPKACTLLVEFLACMTPPEPKKWLHTNPRPEPLTGTALECSYAPNELPRRSRWGR